MKERKIKRIVILVLAMGCLAGALYLYQSSFIEREQRMARDSDAKRGSLEGLSDKEIEELMNQKAEEGSLMISITRELKFPSGRGKGKVQIENSASNRYLMVVEMYRKESGERIYRSGALEPGYYLEYDRLEGNLSRGVYPVEIHFLAYDMESEEYIGKSVVEGEVEIQT